MHLPSVHRIAIVCAFCNETRDEIIIVIIELGGRPHNRCVMELHAAATGGGSATLLMLCKLLLSLAACFQL